MYERILVAIDGSTPSQRSLEEALALARLTGGRLRLLHVIDELSFATTGAALGGYVGEYLDAVRHGGEEVLAQARRRAEAAGIAAETVLHDQLRGRLCDAVAEQVADFQAGLVVIGTHGRRGLQRMLLGSDAEAILRTSPVPVLLVRDAGEAAEAAAPPKEAAA